MTAAWPQENLGKLLAPIKRRESVDPLKTYRVLGARWYAQGLFVKDEKPGQQIKASTLYRVSAGDFVYNRLFAWKGSFAIADDAADNCYVSNEFPCFAVDRQRIAPSYLKWWFSRESAWLQVLGLSSGATPTSRNRLKEEHLLGMRISLPPLDLQHRVVSKIEELVAKLDDARSTRRESARELVALSNSYANAVFERSRVNSRPLTDLCSVITDGTHQTPRYVDDGATFLSAQNVKPFRFIPEVHRKVSYEDFAMYTARNKPQRGDVLLTRVGAGIGEAAVVDKDIEFAIYVSVALIRTDPKTLTPEYLVQWLNSPLGRSHSRAKTLGKGHSQGNLNLNLLRSFPVPVPPVADQRRIVAELEALQSRVELTRTLQAETSAELDAVVPSILDKAFKGELV